MKSPLPVISYRGTLVVYQRLPAADGETLLRVHEFGRKEPLPLTSELEALIREDEERMKRKELQ